MLSSVSAHHANAYNLEDGKFVLDLCPTAYENFAEYMLIENIAYPPEESVANVTSSEHFTRFFIIHVKNFFAFLFL